MAEQPPNKLEHPCFPQPEDGSVCIWRYLDLAKFIWLLENKKLYLPRLDFLDDPHEGSIPHFMADLRDQQYRGWGGEEMVTSMAAAHERIRKTMYVSCWNIGTSESNTMWRLYL